MQHGTIRISRAVVSATSRKSLAASCKPLRTSLCGYSSKSNAPATSARQWSTPLAKTIANAIEVTGPISIASFMRQCLTSPDGGYYTTTRSISDQFGTKGDFITSPEISQIFGELVGIWFLTEWMSQGRPSGGVQFMEVGPGRGTLMADILRTIGQFRTFTSAIEGVWLVEAGEGLRKQQKDVLCHSDAEMREENDGRGNVWWEAPSKYGNGIMIRWVEDIALLPLPEHGQAAAKVPFIIAHEFFDALPIHAFESVAPDPHAGQTDLLDSHGTPMVRQSSASKVPQWRELLVSPIKRKLSLPIATPTGPVHLNTSKATETLTIEPEFHLTRAKASNPSSMVLPERPRYRRLKSQPGSRVEISPESTRYIQDFARRVGGEVVTPAISTPELTASKPNKGTSPSPSSSERPARDKVAPAGAALIIDYGPLDTIPIDSLRGIKSHQVVSPFLYAGQTDISADVDFAALADSALEASEKIEVHGPVEQGIWLLQLGIKERAERLIKDLVKNMDQTSTNNTNADLITDANQIQTRIKDIETGWQRLVESGPRGMGKAYKIMAIVPENGGKRRPVGFGGDVSVQ